ncbi:MAG: hypothetical protein OXU20_11710 [Myxococcales bacterium]|nr:hypothetical protein [Myxococcales bacterium]
MKAGLLRSLITRILGVVEVAQFVVILLMVVIAIAGTIKWCAAEQRPAEGTLENE